jgi:nicotinamide-nucleotide amidase
MTENNKKQAMMPKDAIIFDNDYGTAPALAVKIETTPDFINKHIIMLPGPPRELNPIFLEQIKPYLISQFNNKILHSQIINIFGVGESAIETKLYDLMKNSTNPTIAPYSKMGEVELRITALGNSKDDCCKIMQSVIEQIQNTFGENIYGIDAGSLPSKVIELLKNKNLTIAIAESCTGGYIGKRITDINGASQVYRGGVIAYANEIKQQLLGVQQASLEQYGAVSEQVAKEMAKGIALKLNSDIGISSTGIASDVNDTNKPVGLVFIGYYDKRSDTNSAIELNLSRGYADEREYIRYLASSNALYEVISQMR